MPALVDDLLAQRSSLIADREQWENLWQAVADFILVGRRNVTRSQHKGRERTERLLDATAPQAATLAAAAAHGAITPSTVKWFSPILADRNLMTLEGVADWLFTVGSVAFDSINASNFHAEGQELWLDLFAFGTGCIFVRERKNRQGLLFTAFQPGTFSIAENEDGIADTVFRDFTMTVEAAARMWGIERLSDRARKALEKNRPYDELQIVHVVKRRPDIDEDGITLQTPPRNLPFLSAYIEIGMSASMSIAPTQARSGKGHLISESGFFENPYMVPRWSKASGEVYGRGPGIHTLPDIQTLNQAVRLRLKAWAKAIDPPLQYIDRAVIGDISLRPGEATAVRQDGAIRPIDTGARFDVANFNEEILRQSIRQGFFIDQIQLPAKTGNPASATEIATRAEFMQRILGPVFDRALFEFLTPMLSRIIRLLLRGGSLPPPPPALLEAIGEDGVFSLDFEYEGPLARTQRLADVEAIQRAMAILLPASQQFPEVLDFFDARKAGKFVLEATRVPAPVVRSDEEANAVSDARQQESEQQAQAEAGLQATEGIKNVTPLLGPLGGGA